MKKHRTFPFCFPFFLLGFAPSLHAGTEVKAFLQSYSGQADWVNVQASTQENKLRVDWKGPRSKGSLLYDRDTSQISLVDPIHHSLFLLPAGDQTTLKLVLALFAGQLKKKEDSMDAVTQHNLELVAKNARAFFNGVPRLEKKDTPVGNFSTDVYLTRYTQGGRMREVSVTPFQGTNMLEEDYNTFRSLAHLCLDLSGPLLSQWGVDTGVFEQNFSGSDLPIQETLYVKGRVSMRFKVLGIQARDFEPGIFQPPDEYKPLGLLDLLKQSTGN